MVLHFLPDEVYTNDKEVTAHIEGEGVPVPLALQNAGWLVCTSSKGRSTHSSCVLVHVGEKCDKNIAFEATRLSWLPKSITEDELAGSSEGRIVR